MIDAREKLPVFGFRGSLIQAVMAHQVGQGTRDVRGSRGVQGTRDVRSLRVVRGTRGVRGTRSVRGKKDVRVRGITLRYSFYDDVTIPFFLTSLTPPQTSP